ncbi:hypothetical protein EYV94_10620 [Puteibacter caeruleilacunae]|nr:hypothetical protein EYV94_10620 [Puteibacter caeruleilacunae]
MMDCLEVHYQPFKSGKEFENYDTKEIVISQKVKLPALFHNKVIAPIWDLVAGEGKGAELFVKENLALFDKDSKITDYSKLKLTTGDLHLPDPIAFDQGYIDGFVISSDYADENCILMDKEPERKLDRLCYVLIVGDEIYACLRYKIPRQHQVAFLTHPFEEPENMHVFVFYCDEEMKRFSPAQYKKLYESD